MSSLPITSGVTISSGTGGGRCGLRLRREASGVDAAPRAGARRPGPLAGCLEPCVCRPFLDCRLAIMRVLPLLQTKGFEMLLEACNLLFQFGLFVLLLDYYFSRRSFEEVRIIQLLADGTDLVFQFPDLLPQP